MRTFLANDRQRLGSPRMPAQFVRKLQQTRIERVAERVLHALLILQLLRRVTLPAAPFRSPELVEVVQQMRRRERRPLSGIEPDALARRTAIEINRVAARYVDARPHHDRMVRGKTNRSEKHTSKSK